MKKKERFIATYSNKVYEIAGRWEGSIVLSPVDAGDDRCLIYTAAEMEELLQTGELKKKKQKQRKGCQENCRPGSIKGTDQGSP